MTSDPLGSLLPGYGLDFWQLAWPLVQAGWGRGLCSSDCYDLHLSTWCLPELVVRASPQGSGGKRKGGGCGMCFLEPSLGYRAVYLASTSLTCSDWYGLTNDRRKQLWCRASCSHEGGTCHIFTQMKFLKQRTQAAGL